MTAHRKNFNDIASLDLSSRSAVSQTCPKPRRHDAFVAGFCLSSRRLKFVGRLGRVTKSPWRKRRAHAPAANQIRTTGNEVRDTESTQLKVGSSTRSWRISSSLGADCSSPLSWRKPIRRFEVAHEMTLVVKPDRSNDLLDGQERAAHQIVGAAHSHAFDVAR